MRPFCYLRVRLSASFKNALMMKLSALGATFNVEDATALFRDTDSAIESIRAEVRGLSAASAKDQSMKIEICFDVSLPCCASPRPWRLPLRARY